MAGRVTTTGATTGTVKKWRAMPSLRETSASCPATMTDDELDAAILDLQVRGVPEREVAERLGVTIAQIHAVLDAHARVMLAPENVEGMLIGSLDRLKTGLRRQARPRGAPSSQAVPPTASPHRQADP